MADRSQIALQRMAREDPELAARLVLQTLPAAAGRLRGPLSYVLDVERVGAYRVSVGENGGGAQVVPVEGGSNGRVDFTLSTDAPGLAEMAAGRSALRLVLAGRLKVRGSRLKAMR